MTKKKYCRRRIELLLILMMLAAACLFMLAGCSGAKGDAAAVREDLESMRYVELDPATEAELESILSEEGHEYFEMFLAKAGEFEYEITDSSTAESENGDADSGSGTVVTVRIRTYDFASEYLRSWSDFLEENDMDIAENNSEPANNSGTAQEAQPVYDQTKLYDTLFRNLSGAEDKDYISEVEIHCAGAEDGSWHTDAKASTAVKNAILGGMLNEIASLAGVSY